MLVTGNPACSVTAARAIVALVTAHSTPASGIVFTVAGSTGFRSIYNRLQSVFLGRNPSFGVAAWTIVAFITADDCFGSLEIIPMAGYTR